MLYVYNNKNLKTLYNNIIETEKEYSDYRVQIQCTYIIIRQRP